MGRLPGCSMIWGTKGRLTGSLRFSNIQEKRRNERTRIPRVHGVGSSMPDYWWYWYRFGNQGTSVAVNQEEIPRVQLTADMHGIDHHRSLLISTYLNFRKSLFDPEKHSPNACMIVFLYREVLGK